MKNFKQTGITLIALVITVVVLIILATVAIQLSLGNNEIFNKAKEAKEQYQNATKYEEIEIAKVTNEMDSYVNGDRAENNSSNYSLDEQVIGKWIDGRPIYRKVIKFDSVTLNTSNSKKHNIDNFGDCVDIRAMLYRNGR